MTQILKINNGSKIFLDPRVKCYVSETCFLILSDMGDQLLIARNQDDSITPSCAQTLEQRNIGRFEKSNIFNNALFCNDIFNWDHRNELEFLYKLITHKSCSSLVLDVGCGYGRLLLPLWMKGINIFGVDESKPLVTYLNRELGENSTSYAFCANILDFALPDKIDFAFAAMNTLRYLEDSTSIKQHLNIVADTVKKGGYYIFQVTISTSPHDVYCHSWEFRHNGCTYMIKWENWRYCYIKKQVIDHILISQVGSMINDIEEYQLQAYLDHAIINEIFSDVKSKWTLSNVFDDKFNQISFHDNSRGNLWFLLIRQ